MEFFSRCLDEKSLGSGIRGCQNDFGFTIKVEQAVLSILPAIAFIIACLWRISGAVHRPSLPRSLQPSIKLVAVCIYVMLQLVLLSLSVIKAKHSEAWFITSSTCTFAAALCFAAVSYWESSRSLPPSTYTINCLAISIPFDVIQYYTLWLASSSDDEINFLRWTTTSMTSKLAILLIEMQLQPKWVLLDTETPVSKRISTFGPISAFVHVQRLFFTGYRKQLTLDDLFALDKDMTSQALQARLADQFSRLHNSGEKHALAKMLAKSLSVPFLLPVAPRIALTAFQFCQPFLIKSLLSYLQQPKDDTSQNRGWVFIGMTALVYLGLALSNTVYWYFQERAVCMIRGALAGAVYRKTVDIKLADNDGAALTLMSADVERTTAGLFQLHEYWANSIQVLLSCWLLSREIGTAAIAPLMVVVCCAVASTGLSKPSRPRQKAWMEKIQKRVGLTANIIKQMKFLKISGLASSVQRSTQNMRIDELKAASRFRTIMTISVVIGQTPITVSPILTFLFASRTLDTTTIFTAISYIQLLAAPLSTLLQMTPVLTAAFTCLDRIQGFLDKDSRVDYRVLTLSESPDNQTHHISEKCEPASLGPQAMEISGGNFGWRGEKLSLSAINISIPASQITMVVGPVASGKSTLCKALLGEAPVAYGRVSTLLHGRAIGYCDQTPYLSNATIRKNILGIAPFNRTRYDEVLEAAMLKTDLALLPRGDETQVGSSGVALSGGQKQRISIARALYLDSNFLLFDDVLSGLDADTEHHIFRRVFSSDGLIHRRGATAVLCTHAIQHLPFAEHIIALGPDGHLLEQGKYQSLMANRGYVHSLGIETSMRELVKENTKSEPSELRGSRAPDRIVAPAPPTRGPQKDGTRGDMAVYRHYFSSIDTLPLTAFLLFGIGYGFSSNFSTIWLKFWSEDVGSADPQHTDSYYIATYSAIQLSKLISLLFMCLICFLSIIRASSAKLHKDTLATVINAPLSFFTTTDTGVVTNLFSQDMNLVDGELPLAFINLTMRGLTCLGMAAVIALSYPFLAMMFPLLIAFIYGCQRVYLRTSRQVRILELEAKSPLYSHFIDAIQGIATFRAFGWVPESVARSDRLIDDSQRPLWVMQLIQRSLQFVLQLVVAVLAVVVVTLSTQLSPSDADTSSTGYTGASLVTLMTFGTALANFVSTFTAVETSIGAVSRLKSFGENVRSENLPGENVVPPPEWPMMGKIEITGVSASYDEPQHPQGSESSTSDSTHEEDSRTSERSRLALRDLHLSIAAGEKVAICGRSGR